MLTGVLVLLWLVAADAIAHAVVIRTRQRLTTAEQVHCALWGPAYWIACTLYRVWRDLWREHRGGHGAR